MRVSSVSLNGPRAKLLRWLAFSAIAGCVLLPTSAPAAPTPAVAPPRASLTSLWWQRYVRIPASDVTRCDIGIDKIVFLGATTGGAVVRSCTLSAGTSILVPLINIECSSLEPPPFFGATPAERRACAKAIADEITEPFLTINGAPAGDPPGLRVPSQPFAFSPAAGNPFAIPPGTGGSASDGYWALIGPLAPGTYEVRFGGKIPPFDFATNTTYNLTVA